VDLADGAELRSPWPRFLRAQRSGMVTLDEG